MATRVLVGTVKTPFLQGGAEYHARSLVAELDEQGYEADIIEFPFNPLTPSDLLKQHISAGMLDIETIGPMRTDIYIPLKAPMFHLNHPNRVPWVLHQHRPAYDLWGYPWVGLHDQKEGIEVAKAIRMTDHDAFVNSTHIFANSKNVADRLNYNLGIDSEALYHPPPNYTSLYCDSYEPFFLAPSRITRLKRQDLIIRAVATLRRPPDVVFVGNVEDAEYYSELLSLCKELGVEHRIHLKGQLSRQHVLNLYARCRAVLYTPYDEDYGYVTLESMLSRKPVITSSDSGGVLEFVSHRRTGLVAEPCHNDLARAIDEMAASPKRAEQIGTEACGECIHRIPSWDSVVARLMQFST